LVLRNKEENHLGPVHSPGFPWLILIVLTTTNFLLSYATLSTPLKILLFVLGLLLPLGYWAVNMKPIGNERTPFHQQEFLPAIPTWIWAAFAAVMLLLRFWKIDSLFLWPTGDEGLSGAAAIELSRKWNWDFFYSAGQSPPVLNWICGLLFKYSNQVFLNLWLPPAVLSGLAVFLGYLAARQFFSKSFSFLCAGLLAFSYWPLYLGRLCLQGVLMPSWELFTFFCLGRFIGAPDSRKRFWALGLGLCAGLHSFIFATWPVIVAAIAIVALKACKRPLFLWVWFLAGTLLGLAPFLVAALEKGYGQHLLEVSMGSRFFHGSDFFTVVGGYLSVLLWGTFGKGGFYIPTEGGFLNPLLGTFFCLGLLEIYRHRSSALGKWTMAAAVLFLLPGWMSLNVEGFRIVQLMPLVLMGATWGLAAFLRLLAPSRRIWVTAFFLGFTVLFDFARLAMPYQDIAAHPQRFLQTGKSLARYQAYGILEKWEQAEGPGIVLGEWNVSSDRTLEVATYFFNAALGLGLDPTRVQWLALLTDRHYRPFLEKRFLQAQFIHLDGDFSRDGNPMLMVVQDSPENHQTLQRWSRADRAFRDLNWAIDHVHDSYCLAKVDQDVHEDYPLIQGDPFLESAYWEKAAYFYYYYSGHYPEHLRALQLAVQRGYPAAHLYSELAELYTLGGQTVLAQEAAQKARQSETEFPWR
jgi:hypothetical protein